MIYLAASCFALLYPALMRLCYLLGRQNAINRLIDSKDADAWQYAHFIRADIANRGKHPIGNKL